MMKFRPARAMLLLAALFAMFVAGGLWLEDGAWGYGAMPDKGFIRTVLFGSTAWGCIFLAQWLSEEN